MINFDWIKTTEGLYCSDCPTVTAVLLCHTLPAAKYPCANDPVSNNNMHLYFTYVHVYVCTLG